MRSLLVLCAALLSACPANAPRSNRAAPALANSLASGNATPVATPAPEPPPTGLRLPDHVTPVSYQLELEVDPNQKTFRGTVTIEVNLARPTKSLWLNGVDLQLTAASATFGDRSVTATPLQPQRDAELVGIDFGAMVPTGLATVKLEYEGRMGTRVGLFRQSSGGRWYTITDFEATDARRAFPCFDDPRFKTPWTTSVIVRADHLAFSNTSQTTEQQLQDGRRRITFATTRPLPSYLVAVAVGPFDIAIGPTKPVPIRAIVPRGTAAQARQALQMSPALLTILTDYFGTEIPYNKIDLVSVPNFSGAMENPGLITVAERILLRDDSVRDPAGERLLAMVLAHEYAHLWFGDLVTPRWWNDLWLNEGFATWMAAKVLATWKPAWRTTVDEVSDTLRAVRSDSEPNAQALRRPIHSTEDIRNSFDAITYQKGAAVLAMFENWLGEQIFRDAIRAHLATHADSTASAAELLAALSQAAGRDVAMPFSTFLDQPGVPVIAATLHCEQGQVTVELSQRRYRKLSNPAEPGSSQTWQVPVCVRHPAGRDCTLLSTPRASLQLTTTTCPAWINPNADERGYYRYQLQPAQLEALVRHGRSELTARELVGLVYNLHEGLDSGAIATGDGLTALVALSDTEQMHQLRAVIGAIRSFADSALPADQRTGYAATVRKHFGKRARRLGLVPLRGDTDDDLLLRPALVGFVGVEGRDPRLGAAARRMVIEWIKGDYEPPDTQQITLALRIAAHQGDTALYDQLAGALAASTDEQRRDLLVTGMSQFLQPALLARTLDLALANKLSPAEAYIAFMTMMDNVYTRRAGFAYFQSHYDAIVDRVPQQLRSYLPLAARNLCGANLQTEVEKFFTARMPVDDNEGFGKSLTRALAVIGSCSTLRTAHQDGAQAYFGR